MSYFKVTATVLLRPGPKARKISVPEMCLELQQKAAAACSCLRTKPKTSPSQQQSHPVLHVRAAFLICGK